MIKAIVKKKRLLETIKRTLVRYLRGIYTLGSEIKHAKNLTREPRRSGWLHSRGK